MQTDEKQYDIGVIVARFQVHELTVAQEALIEHVCSAHEKIIIFLGLSPLVTTTNNPLDFEARKQMILEKFPQVNVLYVRDAFDDDVWSRKLDAQINDLRMPGQSVVLYGSRDSFIPHYKGKFPTRKLADTRFSAVSATAARREIGRSATKGSADFRAGVIWASQGRFETAYQCVDVAIFNEEGTRVLLGRKKDEKQFRFIGGFSDPGSDSLEQDVIRETAEEAGVEIGDVKYIGSTRVDDWRYRGEPDCIKTAMFTAKLLHGRPTPGDDIEEVRWFSLERLRGQTGTTKHGEPITKYNIISTHRPLLEMLGRQLKGA